MCTVISCMFLSSYIVRPICGVLHGSLSFENHGCLMLFCRVYHLTPVFSSVLNSHLPLMSPFQVSLGNSVRTVCSPCHPQARTGPAGRVRAELSFRLISLLLTFNERPCAEHRRWSNLRRLTISMVQNIVSLSIKTQGEHSRSGYKTSRRT